MKSLRLSAVVLLAGLPLFTHAAGTRTHVSNAGNDANTAFSCDSAHPCRTFAAALTQTTPGGEILAIDSSGYGKVVIDRSVSIVAAPGVFAGIGVGAGGNATGVEIATPGVDVVLRGLAITGQGGTYGIEMTNGASLSVENCVISNFSSSSQHGLAVSGAATVRVVDTLFRKVRSGITLAAGATASVTGVQINDAQYGIYVWGNTAGVTTSLFVSNTTIMGDFSQAVAVISVVAGGSAKATVSTSMIAGGNSGLYQSQSSGGSAVLESLGNNTIRQTSFQTVGTITTVGSI